MYRFCLLLFIFFISSTGRVSACESASVTPTSTTVGNRIALRCDAGTDIKQVAAQIIGQHWNAAYPVLYDDGTHGDTVAEDNIYTLEIDSPSVAGSYSVTFIRVFSDQTELQSTAIPLTID